MKIIHDSEKLKCTFKDAILKNDCIRIAVFQFRPKILSDICGMSKDEFIDILEKKLVCLYARDWFIYDKETEEDAMERIKDFPIYFIKTKSKKFHPKVFFFTNTDCNDWEAIVSSANITFGLEHDIQSSVHLTHKDDEDGEPLRHNLENYFDYLQTINKRFSKRNSKEEKEVFEVSKKEFTGGITLFFDTIEPFLDKAFTSDKRWEMMRRALQGELYKDISKDWNLSGERARQLTIESIRCLRDIAGKMKKEEDEKLIYLQNAYNILISNYARIAASGNQYVNHKFFKSRLNLLNRLKKTMID